jgi:hypothetical protein
MANPTLGAPSPTQNVQRLPNETYGDWTVSDLGDGDFMAVVANNAQSSFGTVCGRSTECAAIVDLDTACTAGDKFPALINAPAGAYSAELECIKAGKGFMFTLPIDNDLTEAMSVGGVLGFAVPMQSGQFKVVRFSLTGAARATARIHQLAQGRVPETRQPASDNSTL